MVRGLLLSVNILADGAPDCQVVAEVDEKGRWSNGTYYIALKEKDSLAGERTVFPVPQEVYAGAGEGDLFWIRLHQGAGEQLQVSDLEQYDLKERVLLCFGWGKHWGDQKAFNTNFPTLSLEACQYMLDHGVKLIAMDIPSPDRQPREGEERFPVHKLMLRSRVIFVEALANTDQIDFNAQYEFVALPLKLEGLDASPCRAILMEKEG